MIIRDKSIEINWGVRAHITIISLSSNLICVCLLEAYYFVEKIFVKLKCVDRWKLWKYSLFNFYRKIKKSLVCLLNVADLSHFDTFFFVFIMPLACPLWFNIPPNTSFNKISLFLFLDNKSQIYHTLSRHTSQPWPYQHFYRSQHANFTAKLWTWHDEHKMRCKHIASDMEWK